tara:strand:- start:36 stop:566 length:531 start_codon:yes stop_codon:yes gene_type:complete
MSAIIQDNFFEDVENVREMALSCKYFTKENHPTNIHAFPGHRSKYTIFHKDFYNEIHRKIKPHISKLENVNHIADKYIRYNLQLCFSYTLKGDKVIKHTDPLLKNYNVRYGGVVYLNPKPPKDTGTTLYMPKKKKLKNKYNRLVIYNSLIKHEPTEHFGTNINNSRLVLTIFYNMA